MFTCKQAIALQDAEDQRALPFAPRPRLPLHRPHEVGFVQIDLYEQQLRGVLLAAME
jgi:hypothetical protein